MRGAGLPRNKLQAVRRGSGPCVPPAPARELTTGLWHLFASCFGDRTAHTRRVPGFQEAYLSDEASLCTHGSPWASSTGLHKRQATGVKGSWGRGVPSPNKGCSWAMAFPAIELGRVGGGGRAERCPRPGCLWASMFWTNGNRSAPHGNKSAPPYLCIHQSQQFSLPCLLGKMHGQ